MRQIVVSFPSGKDVLAAYWGFLSTGGLEILDDQGLTEGEAVELDVTIESSRRRYRLAGLVVRRRRVAAAAGGRAVIAFRPGEPHDMLLSAAWAEADNVPARRHPRYPAEASLRFRHRRRQAEEMRARLLNVSLGGYCVRTRSLSAAAVGDEVVAYAEGVEVPGVVRWARARDLGVEIEGAALGTGTLDRLVDKLRVRRLAGAR